MADYQKVVEFLRDFRTSPVQTVTDEVRQASADFAELCATANERLRRCAVLLQQGLRSEAIHLAEASPNLLDLVAALDLPDPEGWAEFCQRQDLAVPQALQIERASQLNDAYNQDQPLEQLFARHRRLALSHAKVVDRLDVMRQIAQLDGSPFWEKDIRIFEHARFKELRVSFAAAVQQKDLKQITSMSRELLDSQWVEPIPPDLQSAARDVSERVRLAQMDTALTDILGKLRTAFAAKSLDECSHLLKQAQDVLDVNGAPNIPDAMAAEYQPIVDWVTQEKQLRIKSEAFTAACATLSHALTTDTSDGELESAYRAAKSHDQPLPGDLQHTYELVMRRRSRAAHRRMIMWFTGVAGVLALSWFIGREILKSRTTTGWADKIERAVIDHDVTTAKRLIEDQESRAPQLNEAPRIAGAKAAAAALFEQAERDGRALREVLVAMDASAGNADAAMAIDPPSLDAIGPALTGIEDALGRRKTLPNLAWLDPQNRLAATTLRLERLRGDLNDRSSRAIISQAELISQQVEGIALDSKSAPLAQAETTLAALEKDLWPLRQQAKSGSPAEKALDETAKKLATKRDAVVRARAEQEARRALAKRATSVASIRQALQEFAQRFPESPASADFKRATESLDLYASVEAWQSMGAGWTDASAPPPSDKAASQRLQAVLDYMRDYPGSPLAQRAADYCEYLQQAAEAMAVQNTWQSSMNEVLTSPLIAELKYMETSDGMRYYVLGELSIQQKRLNDRITYQFDALDPTNLSKRRPVVVAPPRHIVTDQPLLAPHAQFVQTMVEQMKTLDAKNWDTFGIDLIGRILADDKMELTVKAILLREVMQAQTKVAAWGIGDTYDKSIGDLTRQRLDQVVWYDPDHPVPALTTANLKKIIAEIPKSADVRRKLVARRTAILRQVGTIFPNDGLLLRDETGAWSIATPAPPSPGAVAWAITGAPGAPRVAAPAPPPAAAPTTSTDIFATTQPATQPSQPPPAAAPQTVMKGTFVRVAAWKGNAMAVDESAVRDLPEGTMLLLTRP